MDRLENVKPIVKASMLTLTLERNKTFEGKADINQSPADMILSGFEITVGDCKRDGVMPNQEQLSKIMKNRAIRDKLTGKIQEVDR